MNFLYSHWLELSLATRNKIAGEFGIIKKHSTEVFNNQIKSDGYELKDIESNLTPERIREYLKTTEQNATVLWNYLIDKMEGREIQIIDAPFIEEHKVEQPIIKKIKKTNEKSNSQK